MENVNPQEEAQVYCPYCSEQITLLIDCSEPEQRYTEDCFVCCRPIVVSVTLPTALSPDTAFEDIQITAQREDDAFP